MRIDSILVVDNASVFFPKRLGRKVLNVRAVDQVSFSISTAETFGLVGESGSGKSTFLNTLAGFHEAESGSAMYEDRDLRTQRVEDRPIAMLFQSNNLFPHLTILQNLTLGPMRARKLAAAEARDLAIHYLERVRIPEQLDKYPAQLSGGQQQRVAIARALCMTPQIMLFDEPTSALDPEMIAEVLDVIEELADTGMTMICVTHEMGFARQVADMMLFMDQGKIVETAPPRTFFTSPQSARCKAFLGQILGHEVRL